MEKQSKEIVWTKRVLSDLRKIYDFNIELRGEDKAHELISTIVDRIEILQDEKFISIGSLDDSFKHLKMDYRKLIEGHYKITYRQSSDQSKIYINRVFDTRQNPVKNK